jgi:hypothetical protein
MDLNVLLADCLVADRRAALQAAAVAHHPARRRRAPRRRTRAALLEALTSGLGGTVEVEPS